MTDEALKERCPAWPTPRESLIEQYEAGDIGPVEFFEEALALDFVMAEIGAILEAGQDVF